MAQNKTWIYDPDIARCAWVPPADALYCQYHDTEWGVPIRDSKALFSKLIQDGMQAGLAWITILRKRESILAAFNGLDPDIVAHYDDAKFDALMQDAGIIRSKLKIKAAITNAQIFIKMRDAEGLDFSEYLWGFVGGEPIVNHWDAFKDAPVKSPESEALSKDLKKRGFKFVGPVIVYAFMQAVGMINDHEITCCARDGAFHN